MLNVVVKTPYSTGRKLVDADVIGGVYRDRKYVPEFNILILSLIWNLPMFKLFKHPHLLSTDQVSFIVPLVSFLAHIKLHFCLL